ncbi:cache domain-containing protein [bacterium]|nr:cache domain-containing protein [bacterium]
MKQVYRFILLIICLALFNISCCDNRAETQILETGISELKCSKNVAIAAVKIASSGLGALLTNIEDETEKIEIIRAFIAPVRFYDDKSGYFYVYDTTCVNIAHATQLDLVGKDLKDYKDSKGKYVIRELAAMAQTGGGFVKYYWNNPNTSTEDPKIGYVEMIPGTPYFIGDGVYIPK